MNNLGNKVETLMQSQLKVWKQAADNYDALSNIKVKEMNYDSVGIKIQFNPARIVSSAAKVDPKSIKERKCFLCASNRPDIQQGINFKGKAGEYEVLVNPFPIFPKHLTIPDINHTKQQIFGRYYDMLSLAESLTEYVIFYNGPKCGASAPDHMHFQAGNKGMLPLEVNVDKLNLSEIIKKDNIKLSLINNYMRGTFLIESKSVEESEAMFERIYSYLPVKEGEWEPMLNILSWYDDINKKWYTILFAREKHRPSHYFAEGEDNILLSPASVDLGGVFITPLEKDFNKITINNIKEIADEIMISKELENKVIRKFRTQSTVSVGIMHAQKINFELVGRYILNNEGDNNGAEYEGKFCVEFRNGRVLFEGVEYSKLLFMPKEDNNDEQQCFWLKDVTIGVNFHWERKEDQRFGGALEFIIEDDSLAAVNLIGVEDYLISVISSEMSATASEELLKAHAVISRSWLLAQIEKNKEIKHKQENYSACKETNDERIKWYDREDHLNFDVCADDHCQRYQGLTRATTAKVRDAVEQTWGEVLLYDDKICDARFSKCCGGVFEEFQNCWEDIRYPYLAKKRDSVTDIVIPDLTKEEEAEKWILSSPESLCNTTDKNILSQVLNNYDQETVNFYRWRVEYDVNELSELIKRRSGIDFGQIIDLIPVERGTSGRLVKLKIVGTNRTMTIGKELEIRKVLSTSHLYSSAFVIKKENNKFILIGAGWGHGVGLCQIGAAVMGEKGYNYKEILLHYYIGAKIDRKY